MSFQGVFIYSWVFGLGLVAGSFLNVCISRIPEKKSLLWPASHCVNCKKRIAWFDNVPVLSYLILRGRCRYCQHKISVEYPIVESITGIVFLLLFHSILIVNADLICAYVFYAIFCCLLIVGSFIDFRQHIIPNEITYTGLIIAPVASLLCAGFQNMNRGSGYFDTSANQWMPPFLMSLVGTFVSGGLIFLCGVIGKLVFKKDAMGFGDVKLMGMIGGFLGWKLGVATFFLAPFFGLLFGLPGLITKNRNVIPYGPFLSIAAFICLLFKDVSIGIIDNYIDVYISIISLFNTVS